MHGGYKGLRDEAAQKEGGRSNGVCYGGTEVPPFGVDACPSVALTRVSVRCPFGVAWCAVPRGPVSVPAVGVVLLGPSRYSVVPLRFFNAAGSGLLDVCVLSSMRFGADSKC